MQHEPFLFAYVIRVNTAKVGVMTPAEGGPRMDQYIDVKQITLTKPTIAQILEVEHEWQNDNPHVHIRDLDLRIVGGIAVGPSPEGMNKAEVVAMLVGRGVIYLDIADPKVPRIEFTPMFQATKEEWEHIIGILDAVKEDANTPRGHDGAEPFYFASAIRV